MTTQVKAVEITLWGKAFVPEAIPEHAIVRCGWCDLVDETRQGHDVKDCNLALREELQVLRAQVEGRLRPRESSE